MSSIEAGSFRRAWRRRVAIARFSRQSHWASTSMATRSSKPSAERLRVLQLGLQGLGQAVQLQAVEFLEGLFANHQFTSLP